MYAERTSPGFWINVWKEIDRIVGWRNRWEYSRLVNVVHLNIGSVGWTNRWDDGRPENVVPSEQGTFVQIVRRTISAPIVPDTTFFGSWERGSFASARSSLTG